MSGVENKFNGKLKWGRSVRTEPILMKEEGLNWSRRMGSLATISTFYCVIKQNNQDFMEGP